MLYLLQNLFFLIKRSYFLRSLRNVSLLWSFLVFVFHKLRWFQIIVEYKPVTNTDSGWYQGGFQQVVTHNKDWENRALVFGGLFLKMGAIFSGQNMFPRGWWSNIKSSSHLNSLELVHKKYMTKESVCSVGCLLPKWVTYCMIFPKGKLKNPKQVIK